MKRIKILLTVTIALTTIGGSLAFKAKKEFGAVIFTGTAANSCPNILEDYSSTTTGISMPVYLTTDGGNITNCVFTYIRVVQ
jgi:hypothetical protein